MDMIVFTALVILLVIAERYTTNKLYGDCKGIKCNNCNKQDKCKFDNEI